MRVGGIPHLSRSNLGLVANINELKAKSAALGELYRR